jgi:nudix-type nucleoside diphosphatase (YffH/AdpP family)
LRKASFDFRRRDGTWQHQERESYDIGDAAAVLPFDAARDRVILIKQFRWPLFEWGYRQLLVEVIAGKLDGDTPLDCIAKEAMEEAGVTIANPRLVTHCFVSPGAVKERVSLFLADYDSTAPRASGGGHEAEGEDITVLEMPLKEALAMIARGEIVDMKTILLLQAAALAS